MKEKLKQIWDTLIKNYDVYAIILIALTLSVLSILGNVSLPTILSGTLATLALIAFSLLKNRLTNDEIQKILEGITLDQRGYTDEHFFKEWNDALFKQILTGARELSMLANANHDFISRYEESLKEFVKKGGKIRYLLLNPESDAMRVFSTQSGGAEKDLAEVCLKLIGNMSKDAPPGTINVKLTNQLPSAIVTMLNHKSEDGIIFTSFCGFNQFYLSRPSLILQKNRDVRLFQFYETYFENLWNWNETVNFDFKRKSVTDKSK